MGWKGHRQKTCRSSVSAGILFLAAAKWAAVLPLKSSAFPSAPSLTETDPQSLPGVRLVAVQD